MTGPGILTVRTISQWTRHEVAATPETILRMLTEACMATTFGNEDAVLIRMGKGFYDSVLAALNVCVEATNKARSGAYQAEQFLPTTIPDIDAPPMEKYTHLPTFLGASVLLDDRFDSWLAQVFMWDRESYELPILFVGATVRIVDAS